MRRASLTVLKFRCPDGSNSPGCNAKLYMYSFALHPGELEPSGHLNFSTVNDARLTMNLEYDGSQGTFDFDDNFIEVLGIPQIDFPKQVIIIAKSYNMMIIRDGKAQILFR